MMIQAPTQAPETPNPGQQNTTEGAQAPKADSPEGKADPKLLALARKEREYRNQARRMQEEKRTIEAQRAAIQAREAELQSVASWKSRFEEDPIGLALERGWDADKISQRLLNAPSPQDQTISQLQKQIAELKQLQEQGQKQAQTAHEQQLEQAKSQMRHDAKNLATAQTDKFGLIATVPEGPDAVAELIYENFTETGVVMDTFEAMQAVEEYLSEQILGLAKNPKILERLKSEFQPKAETGDPAAVAPQAPQANTKTPDTQKTTNTLSNRMSAQSPVRLTDKMRRENALAVAQGRPRPYPY